MTPDAWSVTGDRVPGGRWFAYTEVEAQHSGEWWDATVTPLYALTPDEVAVLDRDTFAQAVALIRQQVGARHAEALFQGGAGEWLEGRAFLAALDATPNPEPPIGDP